MGVAGWGGGWHDGGVVVLGCGHGRVGWWGCRHDGGWQVCGCGRVGMWQVYGDIFN